MRKLLAVALATLTLSFATTAQADDCEIVISEPNWSSGQFMAYLDKFVAETVYGCEAELMPAASIAIATSMTEKGTPSIAGEFISVSVGDVVDQAIEEGRILVANADPYQGGAQEGFYVSKSVLEANPQIKTVEDLLAHPELVGGKVFTCPGGWGCNATMTNNLIALDVESKGFELVTPGSGAAFDASIANADARGTGWFGFYWAPAGMLSKFGLVPLPTTAGYAGDEYWNSCATDVDCAEPQVSDFPKPTIRSLMTPDFAEANPAMVAYLSKRDFSIDEINAQLIEMEAQQATAEEAVESFFANNEEIWSEWFTAEEVAKIKAAL